MFNVEEFIEIDLEPLGEPEQEIQGGIFRSAFNAAQILGVNTDDFRELLLCIAASLSEMLDLSAHQLFFVHRLDPLVREGIIDGFLPLDHSPIPRKILICTRY